MFEKLKKLEEVADAYKKQMEAEGKDALIAGAKELFKKYKDLQQIKWQQYAPHFNDGDACTFSVHDPYFGFNSEESALELSSYVDEEDEDESLYFVQSMYSAKNKEKAADLEAFSGAMNSIEDALEIAFGDGFEVKLNRDGTVEVEEYDHD